MADLKISQLPTASAPLAGTEVLAIVQAGVTDKVSVDNLLARLTAAPPAIGSTTPAAGSFTTLAASGNATLGDAEATDTHAIKGATTVLASSASPALKVTQTGAGNAFVVEDSASTDSTPFVIDANGAIIAGAIATYTGVYGGPANAQFSSAGYAAALGSFSAVDVSARLDFIKSRNTTVGSQTVVASGDDLGIITFCGSDGASFLPAALIKSESDGTPGTNDMPGRLVFSTTADGAASPAERMRIDSSGNVLAVSATGGLGYGTGAGGTVTQATSKSTAVTLNKPCGQITMHNAALAAGASVYFSLVNSIIGSADTLAVHPVFFTGTSGNEYEAWVSYLVAGQVVIGVRNNTAGSRSDPLMLNFAVIKGSTS